jgi:uncharacterized delta-60 repeat protein
MPFQVRAAAGDLDPTFGVNGKVTTKFPGGFANALAVIVQPDGKIVAAGSNAGSGSADFALARYNPDGSLDPTFGNGGKIATDFSITSDQAFALVLQPDGKIIAAGNVNNFGFALARYNVDGSLDPAFGNSGKVTAGFISLSAIFAVALQPDGKIVAAGIALGNSDRDFALARYNPNGSFDSTFGSGGIVFTDFGNSEGAHAIALQPDGKIIAAGGGNLFSSEFDFDLARYNPDGSLDSTFGSGGKTTTDFFGNFDIANSLALQPDGKIVAAGLATSVIAGFNSSYGLARYNINGSLDSTFGSGGKIATDFNTGDEAHAVAIQPGGKIIAVGTTSNETTGADFGLIRYNPNGSLDTGFGSGGKVATDFGLHEGANAIALQPDGKFVVAGFKVTEGSITRGFALARYTPNGDLDIGFGSAGKVTTSFFSDTNRANGVAIQLDGKIVVVGLTRRETTSGEFALARFNSNGRLDPTFGSGGQVVTDLFSSEDQANAVAIQPNGKILVTGFTNTITGGQDFALVRYNSDGSLDSTFGSGGKVATSFFGFDEARAISLQSDGKIIIAGRTQAGFGFEGSDFALARYDVDGSLDPTFGSGGKVVTDLFNNSDRANALALQPDGKIVAAGSAWTNSSSVSEDFALARYNTDGSLDTSFGSGGKVLTDYFGISDLINSIALQHDGKIVAAGNAQRSFGNVSEFALARYAADGSLDTGFGSGGKVTTPSFNQFTTSEANAVAIEPGGKIVVAGEAGNDFALARYNTDGSLDTGFGSGGKVITDFFGSFGQANALALQPDGKIVTAGDAFGGIGYEFAIARYDGGNFDICLQDESNGNSLQFNPTTGDYQFTDCRKGIVLTGRGSVSARSCKIEFNTSEPGRRISALVNSCTNAASASVQVFSTGKKYTIADRNITDNTCVCR